MDPVRQIKPGHTGDADPYTPNSAVGDHERTRRADRDGHLPRGDAAAGGAGGAPSYDPRLEALIPYVRGERKVALHANNAQTILFAIKLAREEHLDAVIYGGREAWKVVDVLAQAGLPVVVGPIWSTPSTSTAAPPSSWPTPSDGS